MAVFRMERNAGYTVMNNHHLRNKDLTLKAKGLLSQMLSLPEDWNFTLAELSYINRENIDAIREAIRELERACISLGQCRKMISFDKAKKCEKALFHAVFRHFKIHSNLSQNLPFDHS